MDMELREKVIELAKTLQDYKAVDVTVLDLTKKNTFTDYFIIATATSATHAGGLEKQGSDKAISLDLSQIKKIQKISDGDEWKLIDLGDVVIHIMSEVARKFYALEKLWYDADVIFKSES